MESHRNEIQYVALFVKTETTIYLEYLEGKRQHQ